MEACDVAIVGGGPAGLSAALVLARACRRVIVIDAGRPRNARARTMHNYLSRDGIAPGEMRRLARAEVEAYGVVLWDDEVTCISRVGPEDEPATMFALDTAAGRQVTARKLLLATGLRDELPSIQGAEDCYGLSVHHCPYCDGWKHRDVPLVTWGETVSGAVGLAMCLKSWSRDVTVLTDGRPLEEQDQLRTTAWNLKVVTERVLALRHEEGMLTAILLEGRQPLPAQGFFFHVADRAGSELPAKVGLPLATECLVETDQRQRTKVPGIFLAGDADGDVQFAIVAAAEGATAAVTINRELQDEDRLACRL